MRAEDGLRRRRPLRRCQYRHLELLRARSRVGIIEGVQGSLAAVADGGQANSGLSVAGAFGVDRADERTRRVEDRDELGELVGDVEIVGLIGYGLDRAEQL